VFAEALVDGRRQGAQSGDVTPGHAFGLRKSEELGRARIVGLVHMVTESRDRFAHPSVLVDDVAGGLLPVRCRENAFDQRSTAFHGADEHAADGKQSGAHARLQ
jgi:hypothetical protein